jgi:hypothetical protein
MYVCCDGVAVAVVGFDVVVVVVVVGVAVVSLPIWGTHTWDWLSFSARLCGPSSRVPELIDGYEVWLARLISSFVYV